MPIFNTSNPFRSSNGASSTSTSNRRGPPRKTTQPPSFKRHPSPPPPPPKDPQQVSLEQLEQVKEKVERLRRDFKWPDQPLQFQPSTSASTTPKLDYTPTNAPVHAYDESLTRLLIELDGIDSCGQVEIRNERKRLVVEVEKELEALEERKKREYRRQVEGGEGGPEGDSETDERQRVSSRQPRASETASTNGPPPGIPLPPRDYNQQPRSSPNSASSRSRSDQYAASSPNDHYRPDGRTTEQSRQQQTRYAPPSYPHPSYDALPRRSTQQPQQGPPSSSSYGSKNPYLQQQRPRGSGNDDRYGSYSVESEPRFAPPPGLPPRDYGRNGSSTTSTMGDSYRRY